MTKEMKTMIRFEFRIKINDVRTDAQRRVEQSKTREREKAERVYQKENTVLKEMSDNESIRIKRAMITRKESLKRSAKKVKTIVKKKTTELVNQDQMMCLRKKIRLEIMKEMIKIMTACKTVLKSRNKNQQRENAQLKQRIKHLKLKIVELQIKRSSSQSQTRQIQFTKVSTSISTSKKQQAFLILIRFKTMRQSKISQIYQKRSFAQATQKSLKDISRKR